MDTRSLAEQVAQHVQGFADQYPGCLVWITVESAQEDGTRERYLVSGNEGNPYGPHIFSCMVPGLA